MDFEELVLHIRRSVVAMVEGVLKTEASQKDVGRANCRVAVHVAADLSVSCCRRLGVRITGYEGKTTVLARHPMALLRKPALQWAKINKHVTYHTCRHTFGALLNANEENPKVVQELLRHTSVKVTTDVYMQAVSPQKREAQSKLVKMVLTKACSN